MTRAYTTACAIPCKGRLPLLRHTVWRLKHINRIDHIVLVGHEPKVQQLASELQVDFLPYLNEPLSDKWNAGFRFLYNTYNPDYYLFAGSSDWISENWMPVMISHTDRIEMVGKADMHLLDFQRYGLKRCCHWKGYTGDRNGEPIGIGRVLTKDIMELMKGKPFKPNLNHSLDYSMMVNVRLYGGRMKLIGDSSLISISVSCHRWENKHRFLDHWTDPMNNDAIGDAKELLINHFPDVLELNL